jgi:hypothetical protein
MPTVDIEENIKTMRNRLMDLQNQLFKLQGSLEVFEGFEKAGLTKIDLPKNPDYTDDLKSIQEKPE